MLTAKKSTEHELFQCATGTSMIQTNLYNPDVWQWSKQIENASCVHVFPFGTWFVLK